MRSWRDRLVILLTWTEEVNAGKKQALKELKEDIHQMAQQAITLAQENMARAFGSSPDRRRGGSFMLRHTGNIVIKKRLAEAQSLQKQIREAELELARIKAKHPVDNVSVSAHSYASRVTVDKVVLTSLSV